MRALCYVELSTEPGGNGKAAASQTRLAPDHCAGHVFEPLKTKGLEFELRVAQLADWAWTKNALPVLIEMLASLIGHQEVPPLLARYIQHSLCP